jgi:hypothetical protein
VSSSPDRYCLRLKSCSSSIRSTVKEPRLWRNRHIPTTTAFRRIPAVHRTNFKGQLRVDGDPTFIEPQLRLRADCDRWSNGGNGRDSGRTRHTGEGLVSAQSVPRTCPEIACFRSRASGRGGSNRVGKFSLVERLWNQSTPRTLSPFGNPSRGHEMKAIRVHKSGGIDALRLDETPCPSGRGTGWPAKARRASARRSGAPCGRPAWKDSWRTIRLLRRT